MTSTPTTIDMSGPPLSWKEIIAQREEAERLERERQLEEGRKAWLQIQQQVKINNQSGE